MSSLNVDGAGLLPHSEPVTAVNSTASMQNANNGPKTEMQDVDLKAVESGNKGLDTEGASAQQPQGTDASSKSKKKPWLIALGVLLAAGAIAGIIAGAVVGTRNNSSNNNNVVPTSTSTTFTATATATSSALGPTPTPQNIDVNTNRTAFKSALQACMKPWYPNSSYLVDPEDPNFSALAVDFNAYWDDKREPILVALPATADQVAGAVLCARAVGPKTQIVARGGGHSYEAYSLAKDGLVVDLRRMAYINFVDEAKGIVDVGAGYWLGAVYELLLQKGWVLPGGDCPSVGIGGHALGGGFGLLSRKWGIVSDTILEMDMVDATGKLLTLSETSNPDLFYAMRGAGQGSYGIVTRFRVQAVPIAPLLSSAVWVFAPADAERLIDAVVQHGPTWPENVTTVFYVDNDGSVQLSAFNYGPSSTFPLAIIEADILLPNLTTPANRTGPTEYNNYLQMMYPTMTDFSVLLNKSYVDSVQNGWASDFNFKAKSYYLQPSSFGTGQGSKALLDGLRAAPEPIRASTWFQVDPYGGRISTCGAPGGPTHTADPIACANKTAFIHREPTISNLQMYTSWSFSNVSNIALEYMKVWGDQVKPWSNGQSYQNYIDDQTGLENYFGGALSKLIQVKGQVDPANVFRFQQSIPVA